MKKLQWFVACAFLLSAALCASAATRTASPSNGPDAALNGTWRIDAQKTKLPSQPTVFYTSGGWYHCVSCQPSLVIVANGTDQVVKNEPYDTLSVKEVDPHTLQLTEKKNGKVISVQTRHVTDDGKMLTVKDTYYPADGGQPVTTEATAKREGETPAGVHATSGKWQTEKFTQSQNGLSFTYKVNGDEVTMTDPTGESYTAKLDGTTAPVKGAYGYNAVSLKKLGPDTIEETDERNGTPVDVSKITVLGDTMTIVDTSKPSDETATFIAEKVK